MCSRVTPSLSSISRCAPERSPVSMLSQNSRHSRGFAIGKTCTANVSVSMCCSHLLRGENLDGFSRYTKPLWQVGKGASGPRRLPRRSQRNLHPSCDPTISPTACGVRPVPIEARSAREAFLDAEPSEGGSEPAVLTDTWRASRMASRTDGGPRVLRAKGVEWPYVQPHGEDPQVAPARQDVLASPGRAKHAVGGAEE